MIAFLKMAESPQEVTQLLQAWSGGEQGALDKLAPVLYRELHRLAQRYMAQERPGQTLAGHRAGERGLPAAGGCEAGELAKPRPLFRRFGAIHAAHPGGTGALPAHPEARQRRPGRYTR